MYITTTERYEAIHFIVTISVTRCNLDMAQKKSKNLIAKIYIPGPWW